jgi:hypothetical protein
MNNGFIINKKKGGCMMKSFSEDVRARIAVVDEETE